ncbi:hypothetical protein EXS62_02085 [Candidatus Kaiserbacteria bacterium]|nr:hypothetical protein [Candidatus Kaiserbacteria bacterium]
MQEDPNQITYFAQTNSRGKELPFGIKRKDRARHLYVIGKTGMGKSTLLENMAIQDIRNGEGVAFIDPHGSTADRIMEYVPEHRIKDVVYFAPFDMDYPVAFNVMEDVGYDKRHLVVSGLLSAFRKIWVDAWSARMEYILSNTLLALLEYDGATLLDVNRMLINKAFRKKVVENVKDPIVKAFWVEEFANYTDRYTQDATPAIQNKVGQFTSNPLIRNIVGQPKSSFDIRRMMDEKKILIMNLSKGRVGEVNATLLGSMLVTKIYLAAMSRADVPAEAMQKLPNFYFYVDEFQNFANESFSDILSEARKYKLNLIIAHQYVEQMEEEVRDAVFGNVGTTVAFRVGPFDAETLETIFAPQFEAVDLVNLGFAQIYLTLMIDGVGSPPFSATTMAPFDPPPARYVEQVLAASRATYGKPREQVERVIEEWQKIDAPEPPKPKPKPPVSATPIRAAVPAPPPPVAKPAPPPTPKPPTPIAHNAAKEDSSMPPPQAQHIRPVSPKPYVPPVIEKPPLQGPKSLKEALAHISAVPKPPAPEAKKPEVLADVLRDMLKVEEPTDESR